MWRRHILALGAGVAAAAAVPAAAQKPPRIVAVGSSITEIIYALGAEKLLVGVDTTSLYPRWRGRCRRSATCAPSRPKACCR